MGIWMYLNFSSHFIRWSFIFWQCTYKCGHGSVYIWSIKDSRNKLKIHFFFHIQCPLKDVNAMLMLNSTHSYFSISQTTCIRSRISISRNEQKETKKRHDEVNEQKLYHIDNEDVSYAHSTYAQIFAYSQLLCASHKLIFASFETVYKKKKSLKLNCLFTISGERSNK